MPKKKVNKNNNLAKEGARGFESPGFFSGLMVEKPRNAVKPVSSNIDQGLPIPELGREFNTRIGNIGTGFTESVDPYSIGFRDILTGNNRTGEIITASSGRIGRGAKRGRGRPRKIRGIASKGIGSYKAVKIRGGRGKPLEFKTKEIREREKKGEKVQTESRSVYQLLKEGKPKQSHSQFTVVDIAKGRKKYDLQSRQDLQEGLQREIAEQEDTRGDFTSTKVELGKGEGKSHRAIPEVREDFIG